MSKAKKQHFVPQFYLENFTDSRNNIYAFDTIKCESFTTTTQGIAHKRCFYDYEPLDEFLGMDQALEKALAKFEAESARVLKKLITRLKADDIRELTRNEYLQLSDYILTQQKRTPEYRIKGVHAAIEIERQLRSKGVSDTLIEQLNLQADKYDAKFQQIYGLLNSEIERQVGDLCDRYWIFWSNETKHNFYTSDNPVVGHLHTNIDSNAYEMYLAITPRYSVSIFIKEAFPHLADKHQKVIQLHDPENVKFYNSLIVTHCNRQIYNAENDFRLAGKIVKEVPSLRDPNHSFRQSFKSISKRMTKIRTA
jgi:hypothetical protein